GIHGHPRGTIAGSTAMRQAVDAEMQGYTAQEYAKTHSELKEALEKWDKPIANKKVNTKTRIIKRK
ncbi:MAG TPA: RuBisCO large subunit C-terminal-like domain-containing protein, partial [archaeon]|nr:RuBisCO large subunit C-terminal-like domain-containing protein [archaeon]